MIKNCNMHHWCVYVFCCCSMFQLINQRVSSFSSIQRSWKCWHAPMNHAKALAVTTTHDMHVECAEGKLNKEWKVEPVTFHRFRGKLDIQMMKCSATCGIDSIWVTSAFAYAYNRVKHRDAKLVHHHHKAFTQQAQALMETPFPRRHRPPQCGVDSWTLSSNTASPSRGIQATMDECVLSVERTQLSTALSMTKCCICRSLTMMTPRHHVSCFGMTPASSDLLEKTARSFASANAICHFQHSNREI